MEEKYQIISIYDYLKYCSKHKYIKGAGVITNKQYIFTYDPNRQGEAHIEMTTSLEEQICPYLTSKQIGWGLEDFTNMLSIGDDFVISLPANGELSPLQLEFIEQALDDIKKYNSEIPEAKRIEVECFSPIIRDIPATSDTDLIKTILKANITKEITLRDEIIIGKTLTQEKRKESLNFHLTFEDCQTPEDVINRIKSFRIYYNDSFYQYTFLELVPNYIEYLEVLDSSDKEEEAKQYTRQN